MTPTRTATLSRHVGVLFVTLHAVSASAQEPAPQTPDRPVVPVAAQAAPMRRGPTNLNTVTVVLDNTGVADWNFLNARRPPLIDVGTPAAPGPVEALEFLNTTSFRTMKVTLPAVIVPADVVAPADPAAIEPALRAEVSAQATPRTPTSRQSRQRLQARVAEELGVVLGIDNCATAPAGTTCTPTVTLGPNVPASISATTLRYYVAANAGILKFTVEFFDDEQQPTRPNGYFVVRTGVRESPPSATWTALASLQMARDPFFGADRTTPVEAGREYRGARAAQFKGFGRASMAYQLGSRAAAAIDFIFKNNTALGTFSPSAAGPVAEDFSAKASQYHLTVFALNGLSLKFGKYDFAIPTDGLAVREAGEGGTLRFRWVGLSHLVKRESQTGAADADNNDHKVWLLEANNINLPVPFFRSASLFGVFGVDDTRAQERRYSTLGGETLFGVAKILEGQAAYYKSRSKPAGGDSSAVDAEGASWLARLSHAWFKGHKVQRNVSVTLAGGSGDRADTPRYEGYLGETANYGGEPSLYLSAVLPRLRVDASGGFPRRGLINRRLVVLAYTDQEWSPLAWFAANILRIPQDDIESRQSTGRFLRYGFSEQVNGSRAGSSELQFETLLESPRGIKYAVRLARLFPRGPLEPLFPQEPWSVLAQCSVALK